MAPSHWRPLIRFLPCSRRKARIAEQSVALVPQVPATPYGVGKSMESDNCYGRPPALGLELGLEQKIEGEKAPVPTKGAVPSFEAGIVYSTAVGGKAPGGMITGKATLSEGWATMEAK